jgi:hypothetical protein
MTITKEQCIGSNGFWIKGIADQTPEQCLLAVQQNGLALEFCGHKTIDICMAAVKQNPNAHKFCPYMTSSIYSIVHNECEQRKNFKKKSLSKYEDLLYKFSQSLGKI